MSLIFVRANQIVILFGACLSICFLFSFSALGGQVNYFVKSPSGDLVVRISQKNQRLYFELKRGNEQLLRPSALGIILENDDSLCRFRVLETKESSVTEFWNPLWGQSELVLNNFNEIVLMLEDLNKCRSLSLVFRLYNDGMAYRYCFPDYQVPVVIQSELSSFSFSSDATSWWIWADYNTLEKLYQKGPLSEVSHVAVPFTLCTDKGTYLSVHEAAVKDYTTMTLKKSSADNLCLNVNLVPWADGSAVKTSGAFKSPWRVIFVSGSAGGLIESNLLLNLNEPAGNEDYSWVKPMNYIGIWWEMHLGLSEWGMAGNRHGATTENAKKYIDFAAENNIGGVLIEGWNTGWENWGVKGAFDFVTPYADFDIREVVRYAKEKGVEIIGHHETGGDIIAYEEMLDSAFRFYNDLGIHYVKTGYAGPMNPVTENHHGQYMVCHLQKVTELAAKYQIIIDAHEPVIPSGLSRSYPNLMTFEAVRGMEWNAWSEGNLPSHHCVLPFTRGLAGPMDYTPGIFDLMLDKNKERRVKWNGLDQGKSRVWTTLSHQIALALILYSPLQMASDLPENYSGHPAFRFLSKMPVSWDETKVLNADIGEYVIIARRKGPDWYLAAITSEKARKLTVVADFLLPGISYKTEQCSDGPDADYRTNPESYIITESWADNTTKAELTLAPGGGCVIVYKPSK